MAQTSSSTRHPEPIDPSLLYSPNVLLLTHVNPSPSPSFPPSNPTIPPPSPLEQSLLEFSAHIQSTIAGGGSVVIPIHSCGVVSLHPLLPPLLPPSPSLQHNSPLPPTLLSPPSFFFF